MMTAIKALSFRVIDALEPTLRYIIDYLTHLPPLCMVSNPSYPVATAVVVNNGTKAP